MLRNRVWFNSVVVALASYENRVQPHTINVLPPISFKKSATVEAGSVLNEYVFINLPDGPVLMLTIRFQPSTSFTAGYGCLQLRLDYHSPYCLYLESICYSQDVQPVRVGSPYPTNCWQISFVVSSTLCDVITYVLVLFWFVLRRRVRTSVLQELQMLDHVAGNK